MINLNLENTFLERCRICYYHYRDLRRIRRYLPLSIGKPK